MPKLYYSATDLLHIGDSNTEFLPENFPRLFRESLFFRASQVLGSFLLNVRNITGYFERFPQQAERQCLWTILLLETL